MYRCSEGHAVCAADIDTDFRSAPVLYSAAGFVWAIAALWASFGFLVVTR